MSSWNVSELGFFEVTYLAQADSSALERVRNDKANTSRLTDFLQHPGSYELLLNMPLERLQ